MSASTNNTRAFADAVRALDGVVIGPNNRVRTTRRQGLSGLGLVLGDSMAALGANYGGTQFGIFGRSFFGAAAAKLGGVCRVDLTKGYGGAQQAVLKAIVASKGSGYAVGNTLTSTGAGTTACVLSVTAVDGSGGITGLSVTNPGAGFTSPPTTFTTNGGGSGAAIDAVTGGSGTHGVNGNTTTQALRRLADVTQYAGQVGWCAIAVGTNNIPANVDFGTTIGDLYNLCLGVTDAGMLAPLLTIPPRSAGNTTSPQQKALQRTNRWIRGFARGDQKAYDALVQYAGFASAPAQLADVVLVDPWDQLHDGTTTTDAPILGMTVDGLHLTTLGEDLRGAALAEALRPFFATQLGSRNRIRGIQGAFDATYNPAGALNTVQRTVNGATGAVPAGLMLGTGGQLQAPSSPSTVTPTGSVPDGWRVGVSSDAAEAAGSTVVCIGGDIRQDVPKGTCVKVTAAFAAGGGAKETVTVSQTTGPLPSAVTPGSSTMAFRPLVNFVDAVPVGVTGVQALLLLKDASGVTVATGFFGTANDYTAAYGNGFPNRLGAIPMDMPAVPVPSTATQYAVAVTINANASTAAASFAVQMSDADAHLTGVY